METRINRTTAGFALAAAVTAVFNTVLACVKDAYKPLNDFMTSLSGHQWKTHGLADLVVFVGLGFLFANMKAVGRIDSNRLINVLIGCVVAAALGLGIWYLVY